MVQPPRGAADFVITATPEALVSIQVGRPGRIDMPRASWRGFLRLSLVSCPIYLSPATSRTKPIRLRQVWRPAGTEEGEDEALEPAGRKELTEPLVPEFGGHDGGYDADQPEPVTRVRIRPAD